MTKFSKIYHQRNQKACSEHANGIKIILIGIIFFGILGMAKISQAATYYVDATGGSDSNTGLSTSSAWKTVSKVNSASFQPGDSVLFKKGEVWRELLTCSSSGSSGSPVTYGAYGSGDKPKITGADLAGSGWAGPDSNGEYYKTYTVEPKIVIGNDAFLTKGTVGSLAANQWGYSGTRLYIGQAPASYANLEVGQRTKAIDCYESYVTFTNLHLYGGEWAGIDHSQSSHGTFDSLTVEKNVGHGIVVYNSSYETFTNCAVQYNGKRGVHFVETNTIGNVFNITISGGTYAYNGEAGISFYGSDHNTQLIKNGGTITGVTAHHNGDGIYLTDTNDVTVSNCTLYLNADESGGGEGYGVGISGGDNNIIENSTIYQNRTRGIEISNDTGGNPSLSNIVRYNRIYDNGSDDIMLGAGVMISSGTSAGNEIYYNIITNHNGSTPDQEKGIFINSPSTKIYNNTLYNNAQSIYLYDTTAHNTVIKNNIVHTSSLNHIKILGGITGLEINYNLYYPETGTKFYWYNTNYNFSGWKSISGQDANSLSQDPLFVNLSSADFHLQSASPCVDKGINVGLTRDCEGASVPQGSAPDIGAYEYKGAVSDTTPPAAPTGLTVQ